MTMIASNQVAISMWRLIIVFSIVARMQYGARVQGAEPDEARRLDRRQLAIAEEFNEIERTIFRTADAEATKNPTHAAVMQQTYAQGRTQIIGERFVEAVMLLSSNKLFAATRSQAALKRDLEALLKPLEDSAAIKHANALLPLLRPSVDGLDAVYTYARVFRGRIGREQRRYNVQRALSAYSKKRVLLVAGGPTRDYRFLCSELTRDDQKIVDVLLQTAQPGTSQDVHALLDHFPTTMAEMESYGAVVAFDPDWRSLGKEAIDLLERWVSERAGGLLLIAGPVYTDDLAQIETLGKARNLYPVEFYRPPAYGESKYAGREPSAVQFTREGRAAEFLRLDRSAAISQKIWADFRGVYGYYSVKGKRPGATIYSRFIDPESLEPAPDDGSIYMAGLPYGGGRVFYIGSGEMWRLRQLDEAYFGRVYRQLLDYVTVDHDSLPTNPAVRIAARLTRAGYAEFLESTSPSTIASLDVFLLPRLNAVRLSASAQLFELEQFTNIAARLRRLLAEQTKLNVDTREQQKSEWRLLLRD
jgi:hypothetical protein